ncbi:hypothetical protein Clacol_010462 [Clathrus columnatus]|uniref:Uncharacterized protein n=1 Tax=Clathrus columnatus TaxID=1419009 RepID=A0AAV5AQY5_9AGAM|nr:hypothetical protein Clacol_010462 [Clathrus columnatus]
MFVEELIQRSRDAPLNIVLDRLNFSDVYAFISPGFLSMAVRGRVKTLYLDLNRIPLSQDSCLSNLISSFPSLENIFFDSPLPANVNFLSTCIQPQVKTLEIGIEHLGHLAILGHFRELSWLSLTFNHDTNLVSLLSVLEALHNLPNLQFLRLFWFSWRATSEAKELAENPKPILTLLRLTVLISNIFILHLIHAPKLLYLDITPEHPYSVHSPNNDTYDRLCGFDFSRITRIWCCMGMILGTSSHTTWNLTYHGHNFHNTFQFLPKKYYNNNSLEWIFDDFPKLDYPNAFFLSSGSRSSRERSLGIAPLLVSCIEKAKNLVEFVLDDLYLSPHNQIEIESLSMALKGATNIRSLIILSLLSLQTLCDLFSDGDLIPNLERITYTNLSIHYQEQLSSYIPGYLRRLKERMGTRTRGLEIELKGFHSIQPQDFKEIEKLGFLRREGIAKNYFDFFISIGGSSIGE